MLANGGTLFGKPLLRPESVATMSSNQVGKLYQGDGNPTLEITAVLMVQQGSERALRDFEHAIRAAIVD